MAASVTPIRNAEALPTAWDAETDRRIKDRVVSFWKTSGADGPRSPVLRRTLTDEESRKLKVRAVDMLRALAPLDETTRDRNLSMAVDGMLNGFDQTRRLDSAAAAATRIGFLHVVRECPPWAIERACELIRTKRVSLDLAWPPSEAQFRGVVDRLTEPYAVTLARIEELLAAPVEPPPPPPLTEEEKTAFRAKHQLRMGQPSYPVTAYTPEEISEIEADHERRKQKAIDDLAESEKEKE
jgi:hypothetical protein